MKIFSFENKRDIYRIHLSHTLRNVALSVINVYIPIFLLSHGYSLSATILFFVVFHSIGVLFALFICPFLIRKWGLVALLKFNYPITIIFFILLNFLPNFPSLFWILAVAGGLSTFSYWIPMNILLIKHAETEKMGSDLANFYALPKAFSIIGPLISAMLIPFIGFWPVFVMVIMGLIFSYLPLKGIQNSEISSSFDFKITSIWSKIRERKSLFVLEGLDNILEESEWYWGIFVFLMIGSLHAPGIVGSLEAMGGALFAVFIGKRANRNTKTLILIASSGLIGAWMLRLFIENALSAYMITVVASFLMTMFLVSYFSMIYRSVKNQKEEEFLILREIPTYVGRMIVFGTILITISNQRLFFLLPIIAIILLLLVFLSKKKNLIV